MAAKSKKEVKAKSELSQIEIPKTEKSESECCKQSKWLNTGWFLLLVGGLAHMLPEQMAPVLKWSMYGISLQMAVGLVSVMVALYFLLEE